ncbi:MAG TPA: hypothetical protein VGO57_14810 [Verrucomicrobiae bacterium]|jgi:hypothetical protein
MPLALVGLAATAVGTGLSIAGNAKSQSALNRTRANEVATQKGLADQNAATFQKSLGQATRQNADNQLAQGQQARMNVWNQLQGESQPVATALPATDSATTQAAQRTGAAANAWNTLNAQAQARTGSYGDWQANQSLNNAAANRNLSMTNNFSQGDARLAGTEAEVASHAGDSLSGWGNIVSSLGKVAMSAGGSLGGSLGNAASAVTPLADLPKYPLANSMINGTAAAQNAQNTANQWFTDPVWTKLY